MDILKKILVSPYAHCFFALAAATVVAAIVFASVTAVQQYRYAEAVYAAEQGDDSALVSWRGGRDRDESESVDRDRRRILDGPKWFDGHRIEGFAAAVKLLGIALLFLAGGVFVLLLAIAKGVEKIIGSVF